MGLEHFCSSEFYDSFPCGMSVGEIAAFGIAGGALALIAAFVLAQSVRAKERGNERMIKLATLIQEGAKSFLKTEYSYLAIFVGCVFAALVLLFTLIDSRTDRTDGLRVGGAFVAGALLSASAGWFGMMIATDANVRTTAAAEKNGLNSALRVAFSGGAVMGFTVVGLAVLGLSIFLILLKQGRDEDFEPENYILAMESLSGFGFGASSIALFARVAGGIYTKAADVGADLVGKVENDIPEDDPRNPAVIADNVGDNVGDVAGMGADLFESYVGSIIAAGTLANGDTAMIALPFWIAGIGIVCSLIGYFFVQVDENNNAGDVQARLMAALNRGIYVASILTIGFTLLVIFFLFEDRETKGVEIFFCVLIGLASGIIIGQITEYFTSYSFGPTRSVAQAGITGPATVVIQGLGIGMISCVPPVVVLVVTIVACDALADDYGIAIAAVGMLSTLGVTLATDAYGPVADNAGGIAEMAELEPRVRETTDALDALGNTTAATGKGFAIGSAVLTSLSLLTAFQDQAGLTRIEVGEPIVLSGLIFGAMLPLLFSALTMLSVQKAAGAIIVEVRRQFREIPGLREGRAGVEPDTNRCVAISTASSVREMILPGAFAVLTPIFVGFLVGPRCLAGVLAGSIGSGTMMALMMSNAGGAWDNAKKYIEIEKVLGGKGTAVHKACVVGDTVGDPFKDTSGPALNILIKLTSVVSLTLAPVFRGQKDWEDFYYGFIPLVIMLGIAAYGYLKFWHGANDVLGEDTSKSPVKFEDTEAALTAEDGKDTELVSKSETKA